MLGPRGWGDFARPAIMAILCYIAGGIPARGAPRAVFRPDAGSFGFATDVAILPTNYAVYQRRNDNTGTIKIIATLSDDVPSNLSNPALYRVEVRSWLEQHATRGVGQAWRPVDNFRLNPYTGTMTASFEAVAGGWYSVQLRVFKVGVQSARPMVSIPKVGVGEVFVTAGQSNATNCGESPRNPNRFATSEDRIAAMNYENGVWQHGNRYPLPSPDHTIGGAPWPRMANDLVAALGVPVGFVEVGFGGTGIEEWQAPDPLAPGYAGPVRGIGYPWYNDGTGRVMVNTPDWNYSGKSAFANLRDTVNYLKEWMGPPRAILWVHGETSNVGILGQNGLWRLPPLTREQYRLYLHQLTASLREQTGIATPWFISQTAFFPSGNGNMMNIVNAQADVASGVGELLFRGPSTYDLNTSNSDGLHRGVWAYQGQPYSPFAVYDPTGMRDAWGLYQGRPGLSNGAHLSWAGLEEHGRRWCYVLLNTMIDPNGYVIRP